MSSTCRGGQRLADDFYETPEWCTRLILPHLEWVETGVRWPRMVLEPAAGRGAIARVVREVYPSLTELAIHTVEIDKERALAWGSDCCDFLDPTYRSRGYDLAITNPPFSQWQEFAEKCMAAAVTTALLLRIAVVASKKRRAFWEAHPADMYVLSKRPSFTDNGKSDSADYAWFVWGPGRGGKWARLEV